MKFFLIFILANLLLGSLSFAQDSDTLANAFKEQADSYAESELYDEAIGQYQQAADAAFNQELKHKIMLSIEHAKLKKIELNKEHNWDFTFGQSAFYDSNVLRQGPESQQTGTQKASPGTVTNLYQSYAKSFSKIHALQQQLGLIYNRYTDRAHSNIYSNDSLQGSFSFSYLWLHLFMRTKAQARYEVFADYSLQDYEGKNTLRYFSKDYGINLIESIQTSQSHDLIFAVRIQKYDNENRENGLTTITPSLSSSLKTSSGNTIYQSLESQFITGEVSTNDSRVYQYQISYIRYLGDNLSITPYLQFQLQDTKEQKDTRGTESNYLGGLSSSYKFSKKWSFDSSLVHRRRYSKEKTLYTYYQTLLQLGASYEF